MPNNIERTACRYAWTYPIIDMGRAELRNCCRTPFNTIKDGDWINGIKIFNELEAIKDVKRSLLKGIKIDKCRTCWKSEEVGIQSPRTGLNDFILFLKAVKWQNLTQGEIKEKLLNLSDTEVEELVDLEHPEHVELSLSTTCDLKCVYCSHVFSTQWATERLKYGEITADQVPRNNSDQYESIWWEWWDKVASRTVKRITFVGGEPLINEKFYQYMDKMIDFYENAGKSKIYFFVATNLNTPEKYLKKFFNLLNRISSYEHIAMGIGVSFESIGKKNEFIRSNSSWPVFNNNIFKLIHTINNLDDRDKKINIVTMPSINSLSVSDLPNFLNYVIGMRNLSDRPINLSNTHVTYPVRYSPFILPPDYIKYIDESINLLKESKWLSEIPIHKAGSWYTFVDYLYTIKNSILNGDPKSLVGARKDFVIDIDKLSSRRNLNFSETFPEMKKFYDFCKTL